MRLLPSALALVSALIAAPSQATDSGQWEGVDPAVRAWYRDAELTKEAQGRFPFKKCCDHADVVKTKFKVDRSNGADEWYWWDADRAATTGGNGSGWRLVPPDVIHWGETAPTKLPTLFIYNGQETCFFPGDGGI